MKIGICLYIHLLDKNFSIEKLFESLIKHKIKIIFTTLIGIKKSENEKIILLKKITSFAKEHNIFICADVNGEVYKEFNINPNDRDDVIEYFVKEIGIDGLRLDEGVEAQSIVKFSNNRLNAKIYLNATDPSDNISYLISMGANAKNLYGGWNFYPQRYTASSVDTFENRLSYFHHNGLPVQAFIALQRKDAVGPWAYNDKLPSIEFHRDKPIEFQLRHLAAMGVDEIIISTQFANEDELNILNKIEENKIVFNISPEKNLQPIEKQILGDKKIHCERKDSAEYIFRSTLSRIKYKDKIINSDKVIKKELIPGDVVILNNNAKNYSGELHIIKKCIINDGTRNYIGHLSDDEFFLTRYLTPGKEFRFEIINEKKL